MASRSDSGNETRGSSESENSPTPTPTKDIQNRTRFTSTTSPPHQHHPQQSHHRSHPQQLQTTVSTVPPTTSILPPANQGVTVPTVNRSQQINTRTTPVSRTTPTTRPCPQQQNCYKSAPPSHRLTPTAQARGPLRPLQRRPPSSGMGSAGSVHAVAPLGSLGPLSSNRGRQRNSVAVVDSRDHIYEELEMCRGPPKLAPVSGVLQQGKVVIRPIAFKPVCPQAMNQPIPGSKGTQVGQGGPNSSGGVGGNTFAAIQGRPDPRYTSTPTLSRGQIQHYGSMGDLKSLGHGSGSSLDRRGITVINGTHNYYDPYHDNKNDANALTNNNNNNNTINSKYSNYTKLHNVKNHAKIGGGGGGGGQNQIIDSASPSSQRSSNPTSPASSNKSSPNSNGSSSCGESSSGHSPPSYPMPPPRPPSHQSTCSNLEDSQPHHHHRFSSIDNRLSSTYDPMPPYDYTPTSSAAFSRPTSGYEHSPLKYHGGGGTPAADLPRYESLRNLSSTEPHSHIPNPRLHHAHHRMGGSVSNLTRLGHHHHHHHHHSGSITGSNLGLDRSLSVTGSNLGLDRSVSGSIRGSLSELRLDDHHQTPSPSDSGVAELEAMLKEKDSEINTLRETMEQNEQVIFKVYEEKEKTWERELKKIRDLYDSRLKAAQQKALKVEQSLSTQTYQLQQERRKMAAELEEVKRERDGSNKQVEQLKKEVASLRATLEETEWGLCQKSGEISLLKTQLKDSQGDQTTRGHELLHLRAQVRQYQQEVERRRAEISSMHDLTSQLRRETAELRSQLEQSHQAQNQDQELAHVAEKTRLELDSLKREKESQRKLFEEERARWVEEKERVIRYQKQLHHNYVSMLSRNRQLEEEVARLTGVPLPPMAASSSCMVPPMLPSMSTSSSTSSSSTTACLPSMSNLSSISSSYSDVREGSLAISGESRC